MAGLVLHKALKSAVGLRPIPHNPCADVEKARAPRREMKVWDFEQTSQFLKEASGDRSIPLWKMPVSR